MRALEGGRDVLNWVCVRGVRPHVWFILAGTIPVARRLRAGRAEGRCLAAMAQTRIFLSRKRVPVCHLRAPSVPKLGTHSYGQNPISIELNPDGELRRKFARIPSVGAAERVFARESTLEKFLANSAW